MLKSVILSAIAMLGIADPLIAAPTSGPMYSLEFINDAPKISEQPNAGRYCGTWKNNGTKEAVVVFRLKRGKSFEHLEADEKTGTMCNADMEAFYKQADKGFNKTQYRTTPRSPLMDPFRFSRPPLHMYTPLSSFKKK